MSLSKFAWVCLLAAVFAFGSLSASARVRQSSDNGQGNKVQRWTVLGRTVAIPLAANNKTVMMTRQVICTGSTDQKIGGCASGNYVFLFQFQSTSTGVTINIGDLQGFPVTPGDPTSSEGVNICDDQLNGNKKTPADKELCTEDPGDPNYLKLPEISFMVTSPSAVQFFVQSFPTFEAGVDPAEGQGLTLFVQTAQGSAYLPIAFPSVGIQ
jgi:hypothetical protein